MCVCGQKVYKNDQDWYLGRGQKERDRHAGRGHGERLDSLFVSSGQSLQVITSRNRHSSERSRVTCQGLGSQTDNLDKPWASASELDSTQKVFSCGNSVVTHFSLHLQKGRESRDPQQIVYLYKNKILLILTLTGKKYITAI